MPTRRFHVNLSGRDREVEIQSGDAETEIRIDGELFTAQLGPADASGIRRLRLGSRSYELMLSGGESRYVVALRGAQVEATVEDERAARLATFGSAAVRPTGRQAIAAPMPGLVVRVTVEPGQLVAEGEVLVVLQAMKMENELGSPREGTIKSIAVEPGQPVELGQLLVELE
jgi:biotin carboxyl carrier protein